MDQNRINSIIKMTGGTATNHHHHLDEAGATGDHRHHGNDAITNGTDKDKEAATENTVANEHGTNNENGHKTTEMGEENRPKRKEHHDDGSKNDDDASQGGEKEEEDHGGSVSVEKRPRTITNNNTSTVTHALQVIWQSLEDDPSTSNSNSNSSNNVISVQVAVKETAALLLQTYNDLIQPATKAMIDLEETKKRLHMLQNTLVSKDREIERLQQSEKQARTSIAVSNCCLLF
jgi:hypothetical protein